MLAATLAPIAVVTALYPTSGSQPYTLWALVWDLVLCLLVAISAVEVPRDALGCRALRGSAAIGSFLVPTALGGNISRLGQYVGGPLLACALLPAPLVLAALAVPLLIWQWHPTVDGIAYSNTDPSTRES